jgi:hypothetical protein
MRLPAIGTRRAWPPFSGLWPNAKSKFASSLAVIDDCGADALYWTSLRAAHFRKDGDHARAELWDNVAALVLKIQSGSERPTYH